MLAENLVLQPWRQSTLITGAHSLEIRLIAGQNPNRLAQLLRLRSGSRQNTRQFRQVAAVDPITAHLLSASYHYPQLPLRLAQFKSNVNRGILASGGCVSVISSHR